MQAASDIFLGWADDEEGRHYHVRQLRDMKTSIATEDLQGAVLTNFAGLCGWSVARAHAKSGHAQRLSGYVGTSGRLADSLADFASSYADQCERDFEAFMQAVRAGRLPAETEPVA
jgi:predicted alpha/beta hydrolase